MAYYTDPRDEDEENKEEQQTGQPLPNTQSPFIAQPSEAGQVVGKEAPKGSGFVNIRKYLEANKPQAETLGAALTSKVNTQADDFNRQLEAKRSALQGILGSKQQEVQQAQAFGQQQLQQAGSIPQTQDQIKEFQSILGGSKSYNTLPEVNLENNQLQAQNLQNLASKQGDSTKKQLLQQTFGSSATPYNRGMRTLDQYVLQSNPETLEGINKILQQRSSQATKDLDTTRQNLFSQAEQVRQAGAESEAGLRSGLEGAFTGLKGDVTKQAEDYDKKLQQTFNYLNEIGQSRTLPQGIYDRLNPQSRAIIDKLMTDKTNVSDVIRTDIGLTPINKGMSAQLLSNDGLDVNELSRMATDEQKARQRALEQLAGLGVSEFLPEVKYDTAIAPEELGLQNIPANVVQRQAEVETKLNEFTGKASTDLRDQLYTHLRSNGFVDIGSPTSPNTQYFVNDFSPERIQSAIKQGLSFDQFLSDKLYGKHVINNPAIRKIYENAANTSRVFNQSVNNPDAFVSLFGNGNNTNGLV